MKGIELWDTNRHIFLTLRDILTALPQRALASSWLVEDFIDPSGESYFELASVGDDHISQLRRAGARVAGSEFAAIAQSSPQVIWASFHAYDPPDAPSPWLTMHAIDSTFWRCETGDIKARQALMRVFKDARFTA